MKDLFRETVFGSLVRLVSGGKLLSYEDEVDQYTLQQPSPSEPDSKSPSPERGHADSEKGKDSWLVEWTMHDPDNPRNWSSPKKVFVTFQICFLTTSVYIGSAIYTAGISGVEQEFRVSQVASLLGLTLFVLGYALGPMIWVR